MRYNCGEKPGIGEYICIRCNYIVKLDDNTDKLPPCPNCKKGCTYEKK